jgi:TetR/AcrR family transcriptional regulator, fatty acid metabolism regulator protein
MAATRQERKETITATRKKQILDAASRVFTEKGFAAATTAEIARLSGVAEGTIYNYFENKRELFIAVIQNIALDVSFVGLIGNLPGQDIETTFQKLIENRLALIARGPASHMPVLMGEILSDPELKKIWADKVFGPFMSRAVEVYRAMIASGKFRQMDPEIAVRAAAGFVIGFLMIRLMEEGSSPVAQKPWEKVSKELIDIILYGMSKNRPEI